jgi:hypothetical protein
VGVEVLDGVHSMLDDEPAIREILSKFQQVCCYLSLQLIYLEVNSKPH